MDNGCTVARSGPLGRVGAAVELSAQREPLFDHFRMLQVGQCQLRRSPPRCNGAHQIATLRCDALQHTTSHENQMPRHCSMPHHMRHHAKDSAHQPCHVECHVATSRATLPRGLVGTWRAFRWPDGAPLVASDGAVCLSAGEPATTLKCNVLQCSTARCNAAQHAATRCIALQCSTARCSALHCVATQVRARELAHLRAAQLKYVPVISKLHIPCYQLIQKLRSLLLFNYTALIKLRTLCS